MGTARLGSAGLGWARRPLVPRRQRPGERVRGAGAAAGPAPPARGRCVAIWGGFSLFCLFFASIHRIFFFRECFEGLGKRWVV